MSLAHTLTGAGAAGALLVHDTAGPGSTRVVVFGESDFSTVEGLDGALGAVPLVGGTSLHLDLGRLTFADVDTVRCLAAFAGRASRAGVEVRTTGATPTVRKVAALLGVDGILGLL